MKKVLLGLLAASLLLSIAAGSATALRSLSINERSIHVNFRELAFSEAGGFGIRCAVTLRIVFNENAIAKTAAEVGNVVAAPTERCRDTIGFGASARALVEERSPWVVLYAGILGTLPNVVGVKFILRASKFLVADALGGIECLYEGDAEGFATVERGTVTTLTAEPRRTLPVKTELRTGCPTPGRFSGTGNVVRLRDLTGGVRITLI
jgi:hypothetical protein